MNRRPSEKGFDAVVVGAGTIGLATAWSLARGGADVCLVDRGRPGDGATRVAAGMLAPVAEAAYGERRLLDLTLKAAGRFATFVADLEQSSGMATGHMSCGALHVALDRDEAAELRRRHDYLAGLGLEVEWMGPSGCREIEPGLTSSFHGGLRVEAESLIDPRSMSAALLAAFTEAGRDSGRGEVRTGLSVIDSIIEGDRILGVRLGDGTELRGAFVVDACGSFSGSADWLPERARVPVRPVKGQILELAPRESAVGPAEPLLAGMVATGRIYLVPRLDGRIIVGATVEEQGFDVSVTAGGVYELLREAHRAVPDVAELALLEATAGLRPGTPDNLPYIGEGVFEGLIHATGHYRNGILLAPITADAVSAIVAGGPFDEVMASAAPSRHQAAMETA